MCIYESKRSKRERKIVYKRSIKTEHVFHLIKGDRFHLIVADLVLPRSRERVVLSGSGG